MVAMDVWPTDAASGSVANESRWRKMGRLFAPDGVVAGIGGELAPTLAASSLTMRSGSAWVDGHYTEMASDQVLTVTANGLAVVRFDPAANTAELLWRDGVTTPTQNPASIWELAIARTTGGALTDLRAFSSPARIEPSVLVNNTVTTIAAGQTVTNLPLASIVVPNNHTKLVFQGTLQGVAQQAGQQDLRARITTTMTPAPNQNPLGVGTVFSNVAYSSVDVALYAQWDNVAAGTYNLLVTAIVGSYPGVAMAVGGVAGILWMVR